MTISSHARAFGGVERDGYRNTNLSGRAKMALADNVSVELRGYYANGRVEFDGFNTDSNDYGLNREFVGYAGINFDLADGRFRNRVAYAYTDTNRDNFNPDRARPQSFEADGRNRRWELGRVDSEGVDPGDSQAGPRQLDLRFRVAGP